MWCVRQMATQDMRYWDFKRGLQESCPIWRWDRLAMRRLPQYECRVSSPKRREFESGWKPIGWVFSIFWRIGVSDIVSNFFLFKNWLCLRIRTKHNPNSNVKYESIHFCLELDSYLGFSRCYYGIWIVFFLYFFKFL